MRAADLTASRDVLPMRRVNVTTCAPSPCRAHEPHIAAA